MGVRISWLMVARNSLLAWLAASAASLASVSSMVRWATWSSRWSRCVGEFPVTRLDLFQHALKPPASMFISAMSLGSARTE